MRYVPVKKSHPSIIHSSIAKQADRGHARRSQLHPTGTPEPPCLSEFLLPTTFKRFASVSTQKSTHSGSNAPHSRAASPSPSSGRQTPAPALNTCTHFSYLQDRDDGRGAHELACLSCQRGESGDVNEQTAHDGGDRFRLINLAGGSHAPAIMLPAGSQEGHREATVTPSDQSGEGYYLSFPGGEDAETPSRMEKIGPYSSQGRMGDLQDTQSASRKDETSLNRGKQRVEERSSASEAEGTTVCPSDGLFASQPRSLLQSPLIPPVKHLDPGEKPANGRSDEDIDPNLEVEIYYVSSKPTCSLNLVCYRSGSTRCERYQIQVALRSRFQDDAAFTKVCKEDPGLLVNDEQFFQALRNVYTRKMCSIWRRILSLKTLCGFRLLSVSI